MVRLGFSLAAALRAVFLIILRKQSGQVNTTTSSAPSIQYKAHREAGHGN
jgi:hypothetical protein